MALPRETTQEDLLLYVGAIHDRELQVEPLLEDLATIKANFHAKAEHNDKRVLEIQAGEIIRLSDVLAITPSHKSKICKDSISTSVAAVRTSNHKA